MSVNKTWIKVENLQKNGNEIKVFFSVSQNLRQYFKNTFHHICQYDFNVEDIPDSIAVIPFIANIFPIAFLKSALVIVDQIDKSFAVCLEKYALEYSLFFSKNTKFELNAMQIINNPMNENKKRSCLLFSGGVDAVNSLVCNEEKITDCYFIQGADFALDNESGFQKCLTNNRVICGFFNKDLFAIRTNFREYYNEQLLDKEVFDVDQSGWWHGYQHGIALLGALAPCVFAKKYDEIYIASSFTKDFDPICASNHKFDPCFSVCNCKTYHDGYEFDRCEKIENIYRWIKKNSKKIPIHVCWAVQDGSNCGQCEKCIRTYLNCICTNNDPALIGLNIRLAPRKIRRYFYLQSGEINTIFDRIDVMNKALQRNFSHIPHRLKWLRKCANHSFFLKKRRKEKIMNRIRRVIKKVLRMY